MKADDLRHGFESLRETVNEGWNKLRNSAAGALTRFRPGEKTQLPERGAVDDLRLFGSAGWAMLGGDVFEDDKRIVVRIETPGLAKDDFQVDVTEDGLVVRGEKRFQSEGSEGRWRIVQCAYGSFERRVPLPAPVRSDEAQATYRDGVLKVELPKAEPSAPRSRTVPVN